MGGLSLGCGDAFAMDQTGWGIEHFNEAMAQADIAARCSYLVRGLIGRWWHIAARCALPRLRVDASGNIVA